MCQLSELEHVAPMPSWAERLWQLRLRGPRFIRNRLYALRHRAGLWAGLRAKRAKYLPAAAGLNRGDMVRIRPKADILKTLDGWKRFEGCQFMDEMAAHCGKSAKVMKRVSVFLDERSMKMKKCKSMVILEGLICNGSWPFGECDRSCYYMWKEAWLEKIE
jgi:hypothetical protein